jgi:hypothetical protein
MAALAGGIGRPFCPEASLGTSAQLLEIEDGGRHCAAFVVPHSIRGLILLKMTLSSLRCRCPGSPSLSFGAGGELWNSIDNPVEGCPVIVDWSSEGRTVSERVWRYGGGADWGADPDLHRRDARS